MQHLKVSNYRHMQWQNGGGETFEIALSPADAQLSLLNFDWRLSLATVASDGPFSLFPDYQRLLVIWQGKGLELNQQELKPGQVLRFSGDEKIQAKLLEGPVRDLGLIFHPAKIDADLQIHDWKQSQQIECRHQHFFYVVEGLIEVGVISVKAGECLRIEAAQRLILTTKAARVIEVILKSKN